MRAHLLGGKPVRGLVNLPALVHPVSLTPATVSGGCLELLEMGLLGVFASQPRSSDTEIAGKTSYSCFLKQFPRGWEDSTVSATLFMQVCAPELESPDLGEELGTEACVCNSSALETGGFLGLPGHPV